MRSWSFYLQLIALSTFKLNAIVIEIVIAKKKALKYSAKLLLYRNRISIRVTTCLIIFNFT